MLFLLSIFSFFNLMAAPQALISDDLAAWYQTQSGLKVNENFAITNMKLYKGELILAMATHQLAAAQDGAMVASLNLTSKKLENLAYLNEQGFIDMKIIGDTLHIPGADPAYPEFLWDSGNWYRIDLSISPRKKELIRNLPFVVHGWGLWHDQKTKTIYHATSRVTCPDPSPQNECYNSENSLGGGSLFTSNDNGSTWNLIDDRNTGVGKYRTYDVKGTDKALFVAWSDILPEQRTICGIARKKAGESHWTRVNQLRMTCGNRLYSYKNTVITVGPRGRQGLMVTEDQNITGEYDPAHIEARPYSAFPLPDRADPFNYTPFFITQNNRVFYTGRNGVYFSDDLHRWNVLTDSVGLKDFRDMAFDNTTGNLYVATKTQVYLMDPKEFLPSGPANR